MIMFIPIRQRLPLPLLLPLLLLSGLFGLGPALANRLGPIFLLVNKYSFFLAESNRLLGSQ